MLITADYVKDYDYCPTASKIHCAECGERCYVVPNRGGFGLLSTCCFSMWICSDRSLERTAQCADYVGNIYSWYNVRYLGENPTFQGRELATFTNSYSRVAAASKAIHDWLYLNDLGDVIPVGVMDDCGIELLFDVNMKGYLVNV